MRDRGRLDDGRAQRAQPAGQGAGLRPRARHRDGQPAERTRVAQPGQLAAQRGDGADDRDRRWPDPGLGARRRSLQRGDDVPLVAQRAALTTAAGSRRAAPGSISWRAISRQRAARPCRRPACRGTRPAPASRAATSRLGRVLVAGDEGHRAARPPRWVTGMPGVGGRGDAGGHAGHDLEGDAGGAQRLRLLAAAAEHERVAALQAHDGPAGPRACSTSSAVGLVLGHLVAAADPCRRRSARRRRARRAPRRDQLVGEDHVGARDQLERARRQQAGVARAGADQVDAAGRSSAAASPARRARQQPLRDRGARAPRASSPDSSSRSHVAAVDPARRQRAQRQRVAVEGGVGADRRCGSRRRARSTSARSASTHRSVAASAIRRGGRRASASSLRPRAASAPWPGAGTRSAARAASPRAQPPAARRSASTIASASPSASLRSRVSTLPRSSTTSRSGARGQQLRGAPQRRGAHARARGQRVERGGAAERVPRVLARAAWRPARVRRAGSPGTSLAECTARSIVAARQRVLELRHPVALVVDARCAVAAGRHDSTELRAAEQPGDRRAWASASALPACRDPQPRSWRTLSRSRRPGASAVASASPSAGPALEPEQLAHELQAAWPWSPSCGFRRMRRLVQQPLHDRPGDRVDARAGRARTRPPSGRRSRPAPASTISRPCSRSVGDRRAARPAGPASGRSAGSRPRRSPSARRPRPAADSAVARDDRLQVVDVVERHALQLAAGRVDVARHGDVDQQQRAPVALGRRPARARRPPTIGCGDEVEETTMSARSSCCGQLVEAHDLAAEALRPARARAVARGGWPRRCVRRPARPARARSARSSRRRRGSRRRGRRGRRASRWARPTATEETDTRPSPIAVSVRTRLPVSSAARNSRLSIGPVVPARSAARRRGAPGPGPRPRRRSSTRGPRRRGRAGARRRSCAARRSPAQLGRADAGAAGEHARAASVSARDRVAGDEVELGAVAGRDDRPPRGSPPCASQVAQERGGLRASVMRQALAQRHRRRLVRDAEDEHLAHRAVSALGSRPRLARESSSSANSRSIRPSFGRP